MKNYISKTILIITIFTLLLSLCSACGSDSSITAKYTKNEESYKYSFSANDDSKKISLSENAKTDLQSKIKAVKNDYKYKDLYDLDTLYERFTREPEKITKHADTAFTGSLTTDNLYPVVIENNKEFLSQQEINIYEEMSEENLRAVLDILVGTVNDVIADNPGIDEDRIYCVLGDLVILYKTFDMDFASVDKDRHLFISKYLYNTASALTNDNADRNILIHECVHLTEIGCGCEIIENCTMRAGLSKLYDDYDNLAFFRWFDEGSTERMTCNITNDVVTTYRTYVNYVCSLDMSSIADADLTSDYFETLELYSDPMLLFDAFNCTSKEDEYEVLSMMASIETIQQCNDAVIEKMAAKYGINPEDNDAIFNFLTGFKPDICMSFTKQFYYCLADLVSKGQATENDICFLIKLFEATLDNHLDYTNAEKDIYNGDFKDRYKAVRDQFIESLDSENGTNLEETYMAYNAVNAENGTTLNASMKCLSNEKQDFLRERTEYYIDKIEKKVE